MFVSFHTLIAPNFLNFYYVDTTVILESNKKKLAININEILPRYVSCSIDCNFPGCDSKIITVKRNSQRYTSIWSRDSIFENRAAKLSDDGTFVCMVGNKMSENNFTLIIHRKSIRLVFFRLMFTVIFYPFLAKDFNSCSYILTVMSVYLYTRIWHGIIWRLFVSVILLTRKLSSINYAGIMILN